MKLLHSCFLSIALPLALFTPPAAHSATDPHPPYLPHRTPHFCITSKHLFDLVQEALARLESRRGTPYNPSIDFLQIICPPTINFPSAKAIINEAYPDAFVQTWFLGSASNPSSPRLSVRIYRLNNLSQPLYDREHSTQYDFSTSSWNDNP